MKFPVKIFLGTSVICRFIQNNFSAEKSQTTHSQTVAETRNSLNSTRKRGGENSEENAPTNIQQPTKDEEIEHFHVVRWILLQTLIQQPILETSKCHSLSTQYEIDCLRTIEWSLRAIA